MKEREGTEGEWARVYTDLSYQTLLPFSDGVVPHCFDSGHIYDFPSLSLVPVRGHSQPSQTRPRTLGVLILPSFTFHRSISFQSFENSPVLHL